MLRKLINHIRHNRFCRLNRYNCSDCIYHDFIFDKQGIFRGNRCRWGHAPIVDVVEVVRCKYCKHSEYWYGDKRRCFLWNETGIDVFEDGYCSYGKRREDDAE